jgi:hypothetical protein
MTNGKDLERGGRGIILRYHPGMLLEGLRKNTKNLSQDSRSQGRDWSPGFPQYEAGVYHTRPRRSVRFYVNCLIVHV